MPRLLGSRRAISVLVAIAVLGAACALGGESTAMTIARPDPRLTPGEIFSGATAAQICVPGYARRMRSVLAEQYVEVFTAYRVAFPQPARAFELDHLIPLELGGDNDNRNLWPQPANPVPGFNEKDELENVLHSRVCSGAMALLEAQRGIAADWVAMYRRFVRS